MKKNLLLGLMLMSCIAVFAQSKTTSNNDFKWKARLRGIGVIPAAVAYKLSATSDVKISSSVVPELDFTYFFTKNLAAELILGTTPHTVKLQTGSTSANLGKVWLLPPTLNLQYHLPLNGITPYAGAGINYTIFYGVKDDAASLSYKNSVGFSTQLGADIKVSDKWFINIDVKKLFLKTDVTLNGATKTVLSGVKIDPWVIGLGIGTHF